MIFREKKKRREGDLHSFTLIYRPTGPQPTRLCISTLGNVKMKEVLVEVEGRGGDMMEGGCNMRKKRVMRGYVKGTK